MYVVHYTLASFLLIVLVSDEDIFQYALIYKNSKNNSIRSQVDDMLQRLISRDYIEAKYTYATMMYAGERPLDLELMFSLWHECSDKGHSWAKANLAKCYNDGKLTPRNVEKAIALYKEAWYAFEPLSKQQAHTSAFNLYLILAESGHIDEAVKWLKIAADEANDTVSQYELAVAYMKGKYTLEADPQLARYYYYKAAEKGLEFAQHNFASMCAEGIGGPKDLELAAYYWTQAYNQDFHWSTLNLALMYLKGEGVPHNESTSFVLLNNVIRFGSTEQRMEAERLIDQLGKGEFSLKDQKYSKLQY